MLPSTSTHASPFSALTIPYGADFISACMYSSSNFLPISLLTANNVLSGFVTACLFAACPTNTCLSDEYATTDGVVLFPSAFDITTGSEPSITETHEFVVPKSIPITFPIFFLLFVF